MTGISLKSHKFRLDREGSWQELEQLLKRLENRSIRSLTDAEMIALPALYRATLSSLSVARATSLDQDVIAYLEPQYPVLLCHLRQPNPDDDPHKTLFSNWLAAGRTKHNP